MAGSLDWVQREVMKYISVVNKGGRHKDKEERSMKKKKQKQDVKYGDMSNNKK